MKLTKKIIKKIAYLLFVIVSVLLLFEVVYRYNFVDFYRTELEGLNSKEELSLSKSKTLLVFGDSFSADNNSYVKMLKDSLKDYNVINSAVPGTSILQTKVFFKDRVEKFKPNHIIIQLYVGNDLNDYSHPVNWGELSFSRNLYWTISDNLIGLQYLNYKLGQFKSSSGNKDPKKNDEFNPLTYNHREKLYFKADSLSLYNAISLQGNQQKKINFLIGDLQDLIKDIDVKTTILVIPHGAQVSKKYQKNMNKIGASFPQDVYYRDDFNFYNELSSKLSNNKVKVITSLSYFRVSKEEVYYLNDPHLNPYGQNKLGFFLLSQIDF